MPVTYESLRLRNVAAIDARLTQDHRRLAQTIAALIVQAAGADGLIPSDRAAREALRRAIWIGALKPYYIGPGTDALIGPVPQSPFTRLLVEGITTATRIEAERQVSILRRTVADKEVVAWLTGPRDPGLRTVAEGSILPTTLAGIAFNPASNTLGALRGPDGRIDVARARAALVKPQGMYEPFHAWVDPGGYRLSDRVWRSSVEVRSRIDLLMNYHIGRGTSATEIAKLMEPFLTPGGALTKTQTPYGTEGSYAARRLARTEVTAAAGGGDDQQQYGQSLCREHPVASKQLPCRPGHLRRICPRRAEWRRHISDC